MIAVALQAVRRRAAQAIGRAGRRRSALLLPVALGTVAAGTAAVLWLHTQPAQGLALAEVQQRVVKARAARRAAPAAPSEARQAAVRFRDGFEPARLHSPRVAALLEQAVVHGLKAVRTEHRWSDDAAVGLQRERVTMPLAAARYEAVRAYIETALQADPGIALDAVRLRRASAQADTVEAELVWSVVQQGPVQQGPTTKGDR